MIIEYFGFKPTAVQIKKIEKQLGPGEWEVCTDKDADYKCKDYIIDSLGLFNPEFLASETGLDEKIFKKLQPLCEDANDAIEALIKSTCGIDSFVESAVDADGRGHFLSPYDSNEVEIKLGKKTVFAYRTN